MFLDKSTEFEFNYNLEFYSSLKFPSEGYSLDLRNSWDDHSSTLASSALSNSSSLAFSLYSAYNFSWKIKSSSGS